MQSSSSSSSSSSSYCVKANCHPSTARYERVYDQQTARKLFFSGEETKGGSFFSSLWPSRILSDMDRPSSCFQHCCTRISTPTWHLRDCSVLIPFLTDSIINELFTQKLSIHFNYSFGCDCIPRYQESIHFVSFFNSKETILEFLLNNLYPKLV